MKPRLSNCNMKYGAPMGRHSTLPRRENVEKDSDIRVYLERLQFYDGDYDRGGAYWGSPADVWRAVSDEPTASSEPRLELFVRAVSREDAKWKIRQEVYKCCGPELRVKFFR
jgi:hypothetical protein